MTSFSAEMIEQAKGRIDDPDYQANHMAILMSQAKELHAAIPDIGQMTRLQVFLLGLETVRIYLAGNPAAIIAKVTL